MGSDLFGEIVRRADLDSIEPCEFSAKRGEPKPSPDASDLTLTESVSSALNDERSVLTVNYQFEISQDVGDSEEEADLFAAAIRYRLVYHFEPALTPEHDQELERFAQHNGRFNCWSFFRAFLSRTTAEFDIPVFTLPLLKPYAPGSEPKD